MRVEFCVSPAAWGDSMPPAGVDDLSERDVRKGQLEIQIERKLSQSRITQRVDLQCDVSRNSLPAEPSQGFDDLVIRTHVVRNTVIVSGRDSTEYQFLVPELDPVAAVHLIPSNWFRGASFIGFYSTWWSMLLQLRRGRFWGVVGDVDSPGRCHLQVLIWICLVTATVGGCAPGLAPDHYFHFIAENDRLFAIEKGGAYGTEVAVHEFDGSAWARADFPAGTCAIAGTSDGLVALTSDSDLWIRNDSNSAWQLLSQLNGIDYASSLLVVGDRFVLGGRYLLVVDHQGQQVFRQEGTPTFSLRGIADHIPNTVIIQPGRYDCRLFNIVTMEMEPWYQGLPTGEYSGCHSIIRHGDRYLAATGGGVYERKVDGSSWTKFVEPLPCPESLSAMWVTRGIVSLGDDSGRWLIADNCGLHVMDNDGNRIERIAPGSAQHSLIGNLARHEECFYVSFYRLSSDVMGGRLSIDDFEFETIQRSPVAAQR